MTQPYDEHPVAPAPEEPAPEEPAAEGVPAEGVPAEGVPAEAASAGGVGDARVDEALARLDDLTERPVAEHAEVFDDIHRRLREALEEAAFEPAEEPRG